MSYENSTNKSIQRTVKNIIPLCYSLYSNTNGKLMNQMHELFDGIFSFNYKKGCCDDSELFQLLKAGIMNLSSEKDQKEMFERFRQGYIRIWLENVESYRDNPDLVIEKAKAEKEFLQYWKAS